MAWGWIHCLAKGWVLWAQGVSFSLEELLCKCSWQAGGRVWLCSLSQWYPQGAELQAASCSCHLVPQGSCKQVRQEHFVVIYKASLLCIVNLIFQLHTQHGYLCFTLPLVQPMSAAHWGLPQTCCDTAAMVTVTAWGPSQDCWHLLFRGLGRKSAPGQQQEGLSIGLIHLVPLGGLWRQTENAHQFKTPGDREGLLF